jgi:hypothetical protein
MQGIVMLPFWPARLRPGTRAYPGRDAKLGACPTGGISA